MGSYVAHTPEDYHRYFHHKGVKAVVRLNNQVSSLLSVYACLWRFPMHHRCITLSSEPCLLPEEALPQTHADPASLHYRPTRESVL